MQLTLPESGRSLLTAAECTAASVLAHAGAVWVALGLTAGGAQLPADEREARVFFLLPPDRVDVRVHQTEIIQWGRLGGDLADGRDLVHLSPGPRLREQTYGARAPRDGSGARGEVPFGPPPALVPDTIFSVLEVDEIVERYDWSAAPAYPRELLALGVEGVVQATYVVDTAGQVDTTSIEVLYSDDPRFTQSVRTALGGMRFRPARRAGHAVRQLVQQQFRFKIAPPGGLGPQAQSPG